MPFTTSEHFAKIHGGFEGLKTFIMMCNENKELNAIASHFNLSKSQACRLREKLMTQTWIPKKGCIEYVEFQSHCLQREIKKRDDFVKEEKQLSLIPGNLNGKSSA